MILFLSFVANTIAADIYSSGMETYNEYKAEGSSHYYADRMARIETDAQSMYLTEVMEQYGIIRTPVGIASAQPVPA